MVQQTVTAGGIDLLGRSAQIHSGHLAREFALVKLHYPEPLRHRKPLPEARVQELLNVEWFTALRRPEMVEPMALSVGWEDFTLERRNELTEQVTVKMQRSGSEWNKCARAFRAFFDEHLASPVLQRLALVGLARALVQVVAWDIVCYMQELNYSDVRPPNFYQKLWLSYRNGRFPCGWDGDYPDGVLIEA